MKTISPIKTTFKCLIFSATIFMSLPFLNVKPDVKPLYKQNIANNEPTLISVPTTLHLKHNNEQEVRQYYANLNNLPSSELKGFNLLKNLKPILKKNTTYVDYNTVWQTSCITERDWARSPIESIPCDSLDLNTMTVTGYKDSYTYKGKGGDDPYLWVLYRNDNGKHNITINANHNPNPGIGGLNKEHVWCQSRGFKGNPVTGPAGTDVHHLIVADALVNQASHNNISYGNVTNYSKNNPTAKYPIMGNYEGTEETYIVGNYRGTTNGVSGELFEPLPEHKGDIARAIFYMAARYNNLANETNAISQFEPNLTINNQTMPKSSESSSDTKAVNMSYLKYLYQWHKEDPVDDFEIYRNDLIYNNVQNNRNPFIDFPSWVDLIWNETGENKSSTVSASPLNDEVRIYGKTPDSGEGGETTPSEVKVKDITLSCNSKELKVGETFKLTAEVTPTNASNKSLIYSSNNEKVATVDQQGNINAVDKGTAVIAVKSNDGSNITKTCTITVISNSGGEVTPPIDEDTTFKGKTTIEGSKTLATPETSLNTGKYFITIPSTSGDVYLDSNAMSVASNGKITANTAFNHNLTTGYFNIVKKSDNKTFNLISEDNTKYIAYDTSTDLAIENSNSLTNKSDWTLTSDSSDETMLYFTNVQTTNRCFLYQISNTRFGGYSTSNKSNASYSAVKLYECIYTYDVLVNKLKTMTCENMQDQNFVNELSTLFNKLTNEERHALLSENIVCNDGKTYTANDALQYALTFKNAANYNKALDINSKIYLPILILLAISSFTFILFISVIKKRNSNNNKIK